MADAIVFASARAHALRFDCRRAAGALGRTSQASMTGAKARSMIELTALFIYRMRITKLLRLTVGSVDQHTRVDMRHWVTVRSL